VLSGLWIAAGLAFGGVLGLWQGSAIAGSITFSARSSWPLVFALDSIPAVFGVTRNLFVVFTSNAFAVLGLRALYFLLARSVDRFSYLKQGLAVLLVFIGAKMLISPVAEVPVLVSLAVILTVVGVAVVIPALTAVLRERARQSQEGVTPDRLRPATPARTRPIDTSFRADTASPRKIMPIVAVPAAPIPVHTAYAAPTSSSRSATVSKPKLISAHAANPAVGHRFVSP
jgi:hypothetical protein